MRTRLFSSSVQGLVIRKTRSIWQPFRQFIRLVQVDSFERKKETKNPFNNNNSTLLRRRRRNQHQADQQYNLACKPAAMRRLLCITLTLANALVDKRFPTRALIEKGPKAWATAPCPLTSRHNRINLYPPPPPAVFYFIFFLFFSILFSCSLKIQLSHHL